MLYKIKSESIGLITEKYRPEPGLEPRVSRLTHEHSATRLPRPKQFCYLNLGFLLITLLSDRVCVWGGGGGLPLSRSRVAGVRCGTCM